MSIIRHQRETTALSSQLRPILMIRQRVLDWFSIKRALLSCLLLCLAEGKQLQMALFRLAIVDLKEAQLVGVRLMLAMAPWLQKPMVCSTASFQALLRTQRKVSETAGLIVTSITQLSLTPPFISLELTTTSSTTAQIRLMSAAASWWSRIMSMIFLSRTSRQLACTRQITNCWLARRYQSRSEKIQTRS